jgi:2-oxoglutarate dehydrogenase E1 component
MSKQYKDSTLATSTLYSVNAPYIEGLYEAYRRDPSAVELPWQQYFSAIDAGQEPLQRTPAPRYYAAAEAGAAFASSSPAAQELFALRYRENGHLLATLDPLGREVLPTQAALGLDPGQYGAGVDAIAVQMQQAYAGTLTAEFSYVGSQEEYQWFCQRFEQHPARTWTNEERRYYYQVAAEVEGFEQFLHHKFPGAKRFSIEGGEAAIAAVEAVIDRSVNAGIERVVIGMAHRGRLNMLTRILGKPYHAMISEFQGNFGHPEDLGITGDVKYHLGYSHDRPTFSGKDVHLALVPNPSHLEAVNPVVMGKVRAEQDYITDTSRSKVMGLLMHGDAAFAGQGVVMETLSMSELEGYRSGGTIHIIVNNQVGFTANPQHARNSRYPTEIAKIIKAPVLHVNGDDMEAAIKAGEIAAEYRHRFKRDICINVVCYRRYGHNEGDEPAFTQPQMYHIIDAHKTPVTLYAEKLTALGVMSAADIAALRDGFKQRLEKELEIAKSFKPKEPEWLKGKWQQIVWSDTPKATEEKTGVAKATLQAMGKQLIHVPDSIQPIAKFKRLLDAKEQMFQSQEGFDWGTAEALAYGSLLLEGIPVRLSGQDCGRGTFSHRNSVILDMNTEAQHVPLNTLAPKQARYEVINSHLSEYGVMGFEYGYSITRPDQLVIWEGQFGDFANGAQIIIDQFLASAETKWQRMSGLVLMLPHGYEGQGPEHSSARLERYLQLCAENNMVVANCSTPANFFHILRRQMHRNYRKPLILITPKSLLRHKLAVSTLADMAEGTQFMPVIGDKIATAKRVVFCSGKVYYDLFEARERLGRKDLALIRIEELYPFPEKEVRKAVAAYKGATFVWCQEEPSNMGAWGYVERHLRGLAKELGGKELLYAGRTESASPAAGYMKIHTAEQTKLVAEALAE